jgi:hypothetical protein
MSLGAGIRTVGIVQRSVLGEKAKLGFMLLIAIKGGAFAVR